MLRSCVSESLELPRELTDCVVMCSLFVKAHLTLGSSLVTSAAIL